MSLGGCTLRIYSDYKHALYAGVIEQKWAGNADLRIIKRVQESLTSKIIVIFVYYLTFILAWLKDLSIEAHSSNFVTHYHLSVNLIKNFVVIFSKNSWFGKHILSKGHSIRKEKVIRILLDTVWHFDLLIFILFEHYLKLFFCPYTA